MTALAGILTVLSGCDGTAGDAQHRGTPAGAAAPVQGDGRLLPEAHRERGRAVLPLPFLDGTRADLVYRPRLGVAALGVVPSGSATLQGNSPSAERGDAVARDFRIQRGDVDDVLTRFNGGTLPRRLASYAGADGRLVGFWNLRAPEPNMLGFQFGRWAVLVYDYPKGSGAAMTDTERAAWSASFSGRETADGFLVLDASDPLRLARAGEHAGPQLDFGPLGRTPRLSLYPGGCRPSRHDTRIIDGKRVSWSPGFASWCVSKTMRAHARGRGPRVETLIGGLAIRRAGRR